MRRSHHRQLEPRDFLILAILFVLVLGACWLVGASLMDTAKAGHTSNTGLVGETP